MANPKDQKSKKKALKNSEGEKDTLTKQEFINALDKVILTDKKSLDEGKSKTSE